MTSKSTQLPDGKSSGEKREYPRKMGLIERWRKSREPQKIIKLIEAAGMSNNGRAAEKFDNALELFREQEQDVQDNVLFAIQNRLGKLQEVPFETPFKAHEIHVLVSFTVRAMDIISAERTLDSKAYKKLEAALQTIALASDPDIGQNNHADIRTMCLFGLGKLGHEDARFWKHALQYDVTRSVAFGILLEKGEEFGWKILRASIGKKQNPLDFSISQNPSPKKIPFLASVIQEGKPSSTHRAFEMAAYMSHDEMGKLGRLLRSPEAVGKCKPPHNALIKEELRVLSVISCVQNDLGKDDESRAKAVEQLIRLVASGRRYLLTALQGVHDTAVHKSMTGNPAERIDGFCIIGQIETAGMSRQDSSGKRKAFVKELLERSSTDAECADALRKNTRRIDMSIARADTDAKIDFLRSLIEDQDPFMASEGFTISMFLHAEEIPEDFISKAEKIALDHENMKLVSTAHLFVDVAKARQKIQMAGDAPFEGVTSLLHLYKTAAPYLRMLLYEAAVEMADIYQDPGGGTEEEKNSQKEKAELALAKLAHAGIKLPGLAIPAKLTMSPVEIPEAIRKVPEEIRRQVNGILMLVKKGENK